MAKIPKEYRVYGLVYGLSCQIDETTMAVSEAQAKHNVWWRMGHPEHISAGDFKKNLKAEETSPQIGTEGA